MHVWHVLALIQPKSWVFGNFISRRWERFPKKWQKCITQIGLARWVLRGESRQVSQNDCISQFVVLDMFVGQGHVRVTIHYIDFSSKTQSQERGVQRFFISSEPALISNLTRYSKSSCCVWAWGMMVVRFRGDCTSIEERWKHLVRDSHKKVIEIKMILACFSRCIKSEHRFWILVKRYSRVI